MKVAKAILCGLVFLVAAGTARGDLTASSPAFDGQLLLASDGQLQPAESSGRSSPSLDSLGMDLWPSAGSVAAFDTGYDGETAATVRDLPAVPGSAQLFLSAMLSVGAWHFVRSAKHFHLADIPEWYHPGGPTQVGHVVPFDLDFSALPVCFFEQPVAERPALGRHLRESISRMLSQQYFLTNADPRAPPVLS
ncbi:MAG: hypothetical protein IID37_13120 [Planctomycetes bacterium]|nr:hypothetical protein [Planctomycetota bacterium]